MKKHHWKLQNDIIKYNWIREKLFTQWNMGQFAKRPLKPSVQQIGIQNVSSSINALKQIPQDGNPQTRDKYQEAIKIYQETIEVYKKAQQLL